MFAAGPHRLSTYKKLGIAAIVFFLLYVFVTRDSGSPTPKPTQDDETTKQHKTPIPSKVPTTVPTKTPITHPHKSHSGCKDDCNDNGWCFLGKCFCMAGFSGETCKTPWKNLVPPCAKDKDDCFVTDYGVAVVSHERWSFAQTTEQALWSGNSASDDRAGEHIAGFEKYEVLPKDLGNVLEIGCGPWTQVKFLLTARTDIKIKSITLWEPGLLFYVKNTPTCNYKNGKLDDHNTILVNAGAEQLFVKDEYDTIILINVLEHVENAFTIMQNAYNALKPGGIFIFNDRWWDSYNFDQKVGGEHGSMGLDRAYHPIRMKKVVFDHFLSHYDKLMENTNAEAFTSRGLEGTYFIGRKEVLEEEE